MSVGDNGKASRNDKSRAGKSARNKKQTDAFGIVDEQSIAQGAMRALEPHNWVSYGAKASWNAMRLLQYPARKEAIEAEGNLLNAQAKALAMAIATQVNIANARYRLLKKSAATAAEYYNIQRGILKQTKISVSGGAASEQALIREEMNTLVAAVEFDVAYADLQNAFAAIYSSIGTDPHEANISTSMSVDQLASTLRSTWRARGDSAG